MPRRKTGKGYELLGPQNTVDEFWEFAQEWGLSSRAAMLALWLGFLSQQFLGLNLYIISGKRTESEQLRLQRRHPQWYRDPNVPQSRHLTGEAFDVAGDFELSQRQWEAIGEVGEYLGLRWGGRFKSPDRPHFDLG